MTKAKERIFVDVNGAELIVRHRKSAVFFERIGDLQNIKMYAPYSQWGAGKETIRGEAIPHYTRDELDCRYTFSKETFRELVKYLIEIALEAWPAFTPKVADSMSADYDSYWDKEIQDEGNLSVYGAEFVFGAPFQPTKKNGIVRLYKFDRRRFESLVFDIQPKVGVGTC